MLLPSAESRLEETLDTDTNTLNVLESSLRVMEMFACNRTSVLVTTAAATRGLDFPQVRRRPCSATASPSSSSSPANCHPLDVALALLALAPALHPRHPPVAPAHLPPLTSPRSPSPAHLPPLTSPRSPPPASRQVTDVLNLGIIGSPADYVHRAGRVGRVGQTERGSVLSVLCAAEVSGSRMTRMADG